MTVRVGDIEVLARLKDEVSAKLKGIGGNIDRHREKYVAAGAVITAFSALAGREWDAVKTTIAQGTGASGKALDELLGSFQNLAGTISGTSNERLAGALADVHTKFGLTGTALEVVTAKTLKAKQAFGDFDIDTFGRSMEVFGVRTEDSAGKLDLFGAIAQDTGAPMAGLISQTQTYGPVLKNLGLGLDESAVFFGKLHESGVDVSRVMPGINQAMRKAAKEGVTDLRGHLDRAIGSIRASTDDTTALTIATETFGAEGAQRMVAAIRSGILPSLADLDAQYENTEGRTEAVYAETVSLGDKLIDLKNQAMAAVGPMGDTAAAVGSVATGAVLAGPQLSAMGASIGTKLLPFLLGPGGLVLLLGAAALALIDLKNEAKNLDTQFANVSDRQKILEDVKRLEEELRLAEEAAQKTEARLGTFGSVSKDVADSKVAGLRDSLEQAKARLEELTEATEDQTGAAKTVSEAEKKLITELDEVNRRWSVQAKEVRGVLSSHYELGNVLKDIEDILDDSKFGRLEFPGTSKPAAKNAEEVAKNLDRAAGSLVTTVAGGTVGGIFNSLTRGDWVGTAIQGVNAVWGWLTGRDDEARERQQAAYDERIRQMEELAEKERERLAAIEEDVVEVGRGIIEWGVLTDAWLAELDRLPDHIDADAIKAKLREGLSEIGRLEDAFEDLTALQRLVEQHLPKSAIDQVVGGARDRETIEAAIREFGAQGGNEEQLAQFLQDLGLQETFEELLTRFEDESLTDEERAEVERQILAFAEAQGVTGESTREIIDKTKTLLDTRLGEVAKLLRDDIKTRLAAISDAIAAQTHSLSVVIGSAASEIVAAIQGLGAGGGGGGGGGGSGGDGGGDGVAALALASPASPGALGRQRTGVPIQVESVLVLDGEVVARSNARHTPNVFDEVF